MSSKPRAAPEDVAAAFVDAWNARDPDALAALFDEDAEFVNVVGLWWHDREAIRRAHAYGLTRIFNQSTLRAAEVRVKRLSEDIAVVHARMALTGQSAVAGIVEPAPRRTIFSFVVHRVGEEWRCAAAHNTDVAPAAETNVMDEEGRLRSVSYRQSI